MLQMRGLNASQPSEKPFHAPILSCSTKLLCKKREIFPRTGGGLVLCAACILQMKATLVWVAWFLACCGLVPIHGTEVGDPCLKEMKNILTPDMKSWILEICVLAVFEKIIYSARQKMLHFISAWGKNSCTEFCKPWKPSFVFWRSIKSDEFGMYL